MYLKKTVTFLFLMLAVMVGIQDSNELGNNIKANQETLLSMFKLAGSASEKISFANQQNRIKSISGTLAYLRQLYVLDVEKKTTRYAFLTIFGLLIVLIIHTNNAIDRNSLWKNAVF